MSISTDLNDWIENPKTREDCNISLELASSVPVGHRSARSESERNAMLESRSRSEDEILSPSPENRETFDVLFARYRSVLCLIAYRVLGNHEEAEEAVQNCLRRASNCASRFEQEGAFRCWLARILIDEAVTILHKQRRPTPAHW